MLIRATIKAIGTEYIVKTGHKPINTTKLSDIDISSLNENTKALVEEMSSMYLSGDVVETIIAHIMNVFFSTESNFVKLGGSLLCKTLTEDPNIGSQSAMRVREYFTVGNRGLSKHKEMKRLYAILGAKGLENRLVNIVNHKAGKGSCNVYILASPSIRAAMNRPSSVEAISSDTVKGMKLAGFSDLEIELEKSKYL